MTWIQTYSGRRFFPAAPQSDAIDIVDIAHALSNLCRFTGHCSAFYSVAQHSVLASHNVPKEHAMTALLHDATEAYFADVARPVKGLLANYKELEDGLYKVIAQKFSLPPELPQVVKEVDMRLLATERRDLMAHRIIWTDLDIWEKVEPFPEEIIPWAPNIAKEQFLKRFKELIW